MCESKRTTFGTDSLLLCMTQELNSGWWQVALFGEPLCWPKTTIIYSGAEWGRVLLSWFLEIGSCILALAGLVFIM